MAKIILEESDVISIAQLWARIMVVPQNSQEQREMIMARMSDKAEDFFVTRMVPGPGRLQISKQFKKAKGKSDEQQTISNSIKDTNEEKQTNGINIFTDDELVDIVQLGSRQEISDATGESFDKIEADIVKRMTDKSLDWYLNHIVPIVGRPILKEKWDNIRSKK